MTPTKPNPFLLWGFRLFIIVAPVKLGILLAG